MDNDYLVVVWRAHDEDCAIARDIVGTSWSYFPEKDIGGDTPDDEH
jgi:hypothetical protein